MDKELLDQALRELLETFRQAKDFAYDEAPEVIRQMVAYKQTISWALSSIAFITFSTCLFLFVLMLKRIFREGATGDEQFSAGMQAILYFLGVMLSLTVFLHNIGDAIKTTWFPKWFIVETLTKML